MHAVPRPTATPTPRSIMSTEMERRAINTVRVLSADVVEKANSGHPGACVGGVCGVFGEAGRGMRCRLRVTTRTALRSFPSHGHGSVKGFS